MEALIHLLAVQNCLGEGPVWHAEEQVLYWVDIDGMAYQRYDPATGAVERFDIGHKLGVLRFRQNGGMVMGTSDGVKLWDPSRGLLTSVINPEPEKPNARCNDGAVDPQGRFWVGTISPGNRARTNSLYRLDPDFSLHRMDTNIGVANGMGWSPDGKTMYFTDSPAKVIYAYDFDPSSGEIANRRAHIYTPDEPGVPDGLIVDREGFLWSARWGGWKISRYDPQGKLEREISVPVEFPTSCVLGGPELKDLYITSAWTNLGEAHKEIQPLAGDIFLLHTDIQGQLEPRFAG